MVLSRLSSVGVRLLYTDSGKAMSNVTVGRRAPSIVKLLEGSNVPLKYYISFIDDSKLVKTLLWDFLLREMLRKECHLVRLNGTRSLPTYVTQLKLAKIR